MALTRNKQAFLESPSLEGKQLRASDMPKIINYYGKKYNIDVILNGITEHGNQLIEQYISRAAQANDKQVRDKCLTPEEAISEIKYVQSTMKAGEFTGYYFTSNHRKAASHFEVYIISSNQIIRPVNWEAVTSEQTLLSTSDDIINSSIKDFIYVEPLIDKRNLNLRSMLKSYIPVPQVSVTECATLGMLYLKELLKHQNDQLNRFTLIVPYYLPGTDKVKQFFFPSPHVLRYSQLSIYNLTILSMLTDSERPVTLQHKDMIITVKTLKCILQKAYARATQNDDKETINQCELLISQLPIFIDRWMSEYKKIEDTRNKMSFHGQNVYLHYKSIGLFDLATRHLRDKALVSGKVDNENPKKTPQI